MNIDDKLGWTDGKGVCLASLRRPQLTQVPKCIPTTTKFNFAPHNVRGEREGYDLLKGRLISWVNPRFLRWYCSRFLK